MAGVGVFAGGAQANFPAIALDVNALADAADLPALVAVGKRLGSEARRDRRRGLIWAVAPFR